MSDCSFYPAVPVASQCVGSVRLPAVPLTGLQQYNGKRICELYLRSGTRNSMENLSFEDLGLDAVTCAAVAAKGFETPTPIQVLAIPRLIAGDANVIAKARTRTGKTATFGLPLVQALREEKPYPQALILTPTRELALQVCKEIDSFRSGPYPRLASVYGGQSMGEQLRRLRSGVEIVVGTPGRVKDHLERGSLKLDKIDYFILDEADEMLDMGFIEDIELIFSKANPASRVLLFSATMPPAILKIARTFMGEYEVVEEEERPEEPVLTEQQFFIVRENDKIEALVRLIDVAPEFYGLVFTQTKSDADIVAKELDERGYEAAALHGDIPQSQREKILGRFRSGKTRILVATDVAARGIDVEGLTHVVNYALPFDGPTYVHRIGRTGRAGAKGLAFTLVRPEERRRIEYIRSVAKGNLKEGRIPSVETVIDAKRRRLFDQTLKSLGMADTAGMPDGTDICDAVADCADGSEAAPVMQETGVQEQQNAPVPAGVPELFLSFADRLCEGRDPRQVLASVLSLTYGEELDPARYRDIVPVSGGNGKKQIRLYVGMGRRDGAGPREIARFFGDLLGIPERLVDRIEMTENFSLATLPAEAAMTALRMSKGNRSLPHMHIDTKSDAGQADRRNGRRFSAGDRTGNRFGGQRPGSAFRGGFPRGTRSENGSAAMYRRENARAVRERY